VPSRGLGIYIFNCEFSDSGEPVLSLIEHISSNIGYQPSNYFLDQNTEYINALFDIEAIVPELPAQPIINEYLNSQNKNFQLALGEAGTIAPGSPASNTSGISQPNSEPSTSNSGPYNCEECGKPFRRRVEMNHHLIGHPNRRRFPCTMCSELCSTVTLLDRHMNEMHLRVEQYFCVEPGCPNATKGIPREDNFRRHLILKHNYDPEDARERGLEQRRRLLRERRLRVQRGETLAADPSDVQ